MAGAALLLTVGALTVPREVEARVTGGYADSLVFSAGLPDPIASLESGEIDLYTGTLLRKDGSNVTLKEALGSFYGILLNSAAPSDGRFNPFTIREIREAMHWAYDRAFLVDEVAGGLATAMYAAHFRGEPEYARQAAFFVALETQYAYDLGRARAQVDTAMREVRGTTFDAASGKWLLDGKEIEIIIVQRTEDIRFDIGAYVATEVEALGFTAVLDPSTFSEALTKVYFTDPVLGLWHMYTEVWGPGYWIQYDDTQANFFYNGQFGSVLKDNPPPASLSIACQTLNDGLYLDVEERGVLLRTCVSEGMRWGERSFLFVRSDLYASRSTLTNTAFDLFRGPFNPFAIRTSMKGGVPGGTLRVGQDYQTGSSWNAYGGHLDLYSKIQQYSLQDSGTALHPHLGVVIPVRSEFVVRSTGRTQEFEVPPSARFFDTSTNLFTNVSDGQTSRSYVDFTMKWGEWHHGAPMSMDDVMATIAMYSRMASGDVSTNNSHNAAQVYLQRWDSSFRGFEILDPDRIRVWFDTYSPDESLIARRADIFPAYPWELNHLISESVLGDGVHLHYADDPLERGIIDLAKGNTFFWFDPRLAANLAASTIPLYLMEWVSPAEAGARWEALNAWRHPAGRECSDGPSEWNCNYYVSNGPYVLDTYTTAPEGAVYTAKRRGYPLPLDAWDGFSSPKVPDLSFESPSRPVQTFPGTIVFRTTISGVPYLNLASASWHLWDPAREEILYSGEAVRGNRPGLWNAELTANQTTVLGPGTYELQAIVVGRESTFPVADSQVFSIRSLRDAIVEALTPALERVFSEFRTAIEEVQVGAERAQEQALAAEDLARRLLVLAVVALGLSVGAPGFFAAVMLRRRRRPA